MPMKAAGPVNGPNRAAPDPWMAYVPRNDSFEQLSSARACPAFPTQRRPATESASSGEHPMLLFILLLGQTHSLSRRRLGAGLPRSDCDALLTDAESGDKLRHRAD